MQRPLVRRRHTVFPNRDLSEPHDSCSVDDDGTAAAARSVAHCQTRPRLERRRKYQSFHRSPVTETRQHPQPADITQLMADDAVPSPTLGACTNANCTVFHSLWISEYPNIHRVTVSFHIYASWFSPASCR